VKITNLTVQNYLNQFFLKKNRKAASMPMASYIHVYHQS